MLKEAGKKACANTIFYVLVPTGLCAALWVMTNYIIRLLDEHVLVGKAKWKAPT